MAGHTRGTRSGPWPGLCPWPNFNQAPASSLLNFGPQNLKTTSLRQPYTLYILLVRKIKVAQRRHCLSQAHLRKRPLSPVLVGGGTLNLSDHQLADLLNHSYSDGLSLELWGLWPSSPPNSLLLPCKHYKHLCKPNLSYVLSGLFSLLQYLLLITICL